MSDLLPCPFCGEPPSEYVNFTWNIECLANEASCNRAYVYADTKEEVRKLWNTRADLQPEPDTVMISRECALEALHAMQNDQARPDFQCGELNEAIDQLKQALEKGE